MKVIDTRRIRGFILAAALGIGVGLVTPASAWEGTFLIDLNSRKVTELTPLNGYGGSVSGLNDAGQVVGYSYNLVSDLSRAFITGLNGVGMTYLKSSSDDTRAYGINDGGRVVGSEMSGGALRAFITGPNGVGTTDLDGNNAEPSGINATGQVVGTSNLLFGPANEHGSGNAFITGPNGVGMTDLGALGGDLSSASGINDAGQVVGSAETSVYKPHDIFGDRFSHAFITGPNGVGMRDLGTLSGGDSLATDINAAGQVVGASNTSSQFEHAFITGPNGMGMTDLGTLDGGAASYAAGINDAGQVVGYSIEYDPYFQSHAFVTGPNGVGMTDLNSLVSLPAGVVLSEATAINDAGQVLAISVVPEPQTYALMLAGLFLTGVMVRRKQKG